MAAFGGWRLTRAGILFIIGILVLGGLVTGGVFYVKNHGEAVRRDQAVKIAEQNLEDQSKTETKTTTNTDKDQNQGSATPSAQGGTDTTTVASTNPGTSALPETGIDDLQVLGTSAVLAVVAFSVVSYVMSRRAYNRS